MKTVLPRRMSPQLGDVSHADYDASERMQPWQKTAFLELIVGGASQHRAASQLGIPYMTVVREAHRDPQFAEDRELAIQARVDAIEEKAFEFATDGNKKDVYHQGIVVGEEVTFGPHSLLQFLLKGNKPERYKERSEQTLNVQKNEPPPAVRNDQDAQRLLAKMQAELRPVIEGQFVEVKQTNDIGDLL